MESQENSIEGRYGLYKLLRDGTFTDAIIIASNQQFSAHKVILATASGYFRALLTTGLELGQQSYIDLKNVPGDIMSLLLNYIYLKQLPLTHENVCQVFVVADYLIMDNVMKHCIKYLISNLSAENCLGLLSFSRTYSITKLNDRVWRYFLRHAADVSKTPEFLELDGPDIITLLQSNHLNVRSEEKVWEMAVAWLEHKPARFQYLPDILKCIRLGLINSEYFLENIRDYPAIATSDECLPILNDTMRFLFDLDVEVAPDLQRRIMNMACPRFPSEILFAVGGWSGGSPTSCIETYDVRANQWTMIVETDPMGPRSYHGTVVMGNNMYIIGGYNGVDYYNSCRCYDVNRRTWKEIAPMNKSRCYVSVAVCGKYIYAMGGFNGRTRQNTAERYDTERNQWTMIAEMHMPRSDASADSINDKIYIVGGFSGQECLNTVEMYDPSREEWRFLPPMTSKRSGVSCIFFNDLLYVLGGFNGVNRMASGEKYDTKTNKWSAVPDMIHARSNFALTALEGALFVVGGFNGVSVTSDAECYKPETGQWSAVSPLNVQRSALSACTFTDMLDVEYYAFNQTVGLLLERQDALTENVETATRLPEEPRENLAARASRIQRYYGRHT